MSKWLDMLIHEQNADTRYELEERAAIIEFDGHESESEYRSLMLFIEDNKVCLQKHIVTINGERYLRLKEYS